MSVIRIIVSLDQEERIALMRLAQFEKRTEAQISALAERLPGSFQDISQMEIRRRLDNLEKSRYEEDNRKQMKQGIILQRWQVIIGLIGIVFSCIMGVG